VIKVLIVDDHTLVRMGLRRLLADLPDIEVVADVESGEQALALIKAHAPDVVLLDMKMPGGIDGLEVTRRLRKSNRNVKVIAVTALSSEVLPARLLQSGARGYITKEAGAEEMADAIRKVSKGERYLSAVIAQKVAMNSLQEVQGSPFSLLSEREMQVMFMITSGMNVHEISERLFLSPKTVNTHRYRTFDKLGITNNVELTYLAIEHGIIEAKEKE
jgi:two-component system invasion response regulator UvrY